MERSEFEKLELIVNEKISFIDNNGVTHYGTYKGKYDASIPCFNFIEKTDKKEKTIYLKEIEKVFTSENA